MVWGEQSLKVWELRCCEHLEEKDDLISDKGVCRTAPATPTAVSAAR